MDDYELANDEADITVLDADAPANSVCDRSEDVEAAILNRKLAQTDPPAGALTAATPNATT